MVCALLFSLGRRGWLEGQHRLQRILRYHRQHIRSEIQAAPSTERRVAATIMHAAL